jgi:hypothetical protein
MRTFARSTPIDRLSLEARVVYTLFCLFLLIGYATSAWFYADDELGAAPASAARYYLGEAEAATPAPAPSEDGPALDLPEEAPAATSLRIAKPARQVMETFHFHLFSVSVCLLILGHLFMMCRLSVRTKSTLLVVAGVSTLLHLLAPPLIRFVGPGFAALMFPSAVLMGLSWLVLTVWPVWEMWRPVPAANA